MSMLPKLLLILPASSAPVPVKLLYEPLILAFGTVPLSKFVAFSPSIPLPSAVFNEPANKSPATPIPPPTLTAPVVVFVALVVSLNVFTPVMVWLPPSLAPATVPLDKLVAFSVVKPLPLPVNVLVPMLISPNVVVILPLVSVPTPVRLLF